jgi:inner membrane protein
METIEKNVNRFFNSVGVKLALIVLLTLVMLIPAQMIKNLIAERQQRHDETVKEITSLWGNDQTICGPVLTIPYKVYDNAGSNESKTTSKLAHFLPENLKIVGTMVPEMRYRGIFKVITYRTKLHISGSFADINPEELGIHASDITDKNASLEIGISDMRGINQNISIKWNDDMKTIIPGVSRESLAESGLHAEIPIGFPIKGSFSFDIDLNGSQSLGFIPLGKETIVNLTSTWKTPSFNGTFLPDHRIINKSGFQATWNVLQLNRSYPQQWTGQQYNIQDSSFGVELITPVDTYQKSMRSAKYAILFIALTFLVFFFGEVMTKNRIHPINYMLVGVALCIFFSLLIALAEHIPFNAAYLAGSITIIGMITVFTHSLYKKRGVTLTVISMLTTLYLFLFVILQLMDYSLLFGNIGLVIILAIVMYFSTKIDWYSPVKNLKESGK